MKTNGNLFFHFVAIILHSRALGFQCSFIFNSSIRPEITWRASSSTQGNSSPCIISHPSTSITVLNPLSKRKIQVGGPKYNEFMKQGGWIQYHGTLKQLNFDALCDYQQQRSPQSDDNLEAKIDESLAEDWYCILPSIVSQDERVLLDEDTALHVRNNLLFVNKPSGLNCVPARDPNIDSLSFQVSSLYGENVKPCHRLDRDTSGIVVFGLSPESHRHVSKQFEARTTTKTYVALIAGHPDQDHGVIDLPIGKMKTEEGFNRWAIGGEKPRRAVTEWNVVERFTNCGARWSRVNLSPKTGRGHQLRLHMKAMGHPILGDNIHGEGGVISCSPRLCLHAHKLQLNWTHGERIEAESVAPF